jgi:hypothetical protein
MIPASTASLRLMRLARRLTLTSRISKERFPYIRLPAAKTSCRAGAPSGCSPSTNDRMKSPNHESPRGEMGALRVIPFDRPASTYRSVLPLVDEDSLVEARGEAAAYGALQLGRAHVQPGFVAAGERGLGQILLGRGRAHREAPLTHRREGLAQVLQGSLLGGRQLERRAEPLQLRAKRRPPLGGLIDQRLPSCGCCDLVEPRLEEPGCEEHAGRHGKPGVEHPYQGIAPCCRRRSRSAGRTRETRRSTSMTSPRGCVSNGNRAPQGLRPRMRRDCEPPRSSE